MLPQLMPSLLSDPCNHQQDHHYIFAHSGMKAEARIREATRPYIRILTNLQL